MHMTFEKIEPEDFEPNPVKRSAKIIQQMHRDTIALIDKGQVFMDGGRDVSQEIRGRCLKEIEKCDALLVAADTMSSGHLEEAEKMLTEAGFDNIVPEINIELARLESTMETKQ
jgi:hypothetical protein